MTDSYMVGVRLMTVAFTLFLLSFTHETHWAYHIAYTAPALGLIIFSQTLTGKCFWRMSLIHTGLGAIALIHSYMGGFQP